MEIVSEFVAVWDDILSQEFCDEIIDWFESVEIDISSDPEKLIDHNKYQVRDGAKTYGGVNRRKDISYFANYLDAPFETKLRGTLNECAQEYVQTYPNVIESYHLSNRDLKVQKTPPGGGYHIWHHEHSYESNMRILVWTAYLNDIPEGEGETEFLYQGLKVNPKRGRVCIFPAAYTHLHRGNPPYSCDKYIATGWFVAHPTE